MDIKQQFLINGASVDIEDVPSECLRVFCEGINREIKRRKSEAIGKRIAVSRCS